MQIYTYIDSNLATQDDSFNLDWLINRQNKNKKGKKSQNQFDFYSDLAFADKKALKKFEKESQLNHDKIQAKVLRQRKQERKSALKQEKYLQKQQACTKIRGNRHQDIQMACVQEKLVDKKVSKENAKIQHEQVKNEIGGDVRSVLTNHKGFFITFSAIYFFVAVSAVVFTNVRLPLQKVSMLLPDESEFCILDTALKNFAFSIDVNDMVDDSGYIANSGSKLKYALESVTYKNYTVRSGDNITKIARKFGLSNISTIISVNGITNDRSLRIGEVIRIPSTDGIIHKVAKNESLASISKKYGVSAEALLDVNDLSSSTLTVGQELFIPGARLDPNVIKQTLGKMFMTPIKVKWRLTSPYGDRPDPFTGVRKFHTGMDMACPMGTPVYATMDGKVIEVSFNRIYGNYIVISHANGYQSLYAHLSATGVKKGQYVMQGSKIGNVGSTGYSTGPHLHFTVYKNGKLVNPQKLLNN